MGFLQPGLPLCGEMDPKPEGIKGWQEEERDSRPHDDAADEDEGEGAPEGVGGQGDEGKDGGGGGKHDRA